MKRVYLDIKMKKKTILYEVIEKPFKVIIATTCKRSHNTQIQCQTYFNK